MGMSTMERLRFKRRTFHAPNLIHKFLSFSVRSHVKFTRVNAKEAMYEKPRVKVKAERGSPSIHCLYFIYASKIYVRTHVKIMHQRTSTLTTFHG